MIHGFQNILNDLSDKIKASEIGKRELEHRLLELIAVEIDKDELDRATWLKAFSEAGGSREKAEALYIKHRLQRLLDQLGVLEMASKSHSRAIKSARKPAAAPDQEARQTKPARKPSSKSRGIDNSVMYIIWFIVFSLCFLSVFVLRATGVL